MSALDDYDEPDDIGFSGFAASREAVEAGLLVEVNGEIRVTQKGLAVLAEMVRQGRIAKEVDR
ncbi:MAG: hypothetical protein QM661_09610 [Solimonas sp.]